MRGTTSEVERGARPSCGRDPKTGEDAAPIQWRARTRAGGRRTFKTCAVVAAWTARAKRGDVPGDDGSMVCRARPGRGPAPGTGAGTTGTDIEVETVPSGRVGIISSPGTGNSPGTPPRRSPRPPGNWLSTRTGSRRFVSPPKPQKTRGETKLDQLDAEAGGWLARGFGHAMHPRHPLRLASACGYPGGPISWAGSRRAGLPYRETASDTASARRDGRCRARAHASTRGGHRAGGAAKRRISLRSPPDGRGSGIRGSRRRGEARRRDPDAQGDVETSDDGDAHTRFLHPREK